MYKVRFCVLMKILLSFSVQKSLHNLSIINKWGNSFPALSQLQKPIFGFCVPVSYFRSLAALFANTLAPYATAFQTIPFHPFRHTICHPLFTPDREPSLLTAFLFLFTLIYIGIYIEKNSKERISQWWIVE